MLHRKDHSRIKEAWYCAEEEKPVERDEIVKGYEYEKGEYVVVTDEELKSVAPPTATTMEILQFVRADEVDPVYLESSYYLGPEEDVSKPYNLLLDALKQTKYYAIAKVAMHNREHIVIIRPTSRGMMLHTMYYANELHEANAAGHTAKGKHTEKEMALAKNLINTLAAPFKPEEYHDRYRENVEHLIEQKLKGEKPARRKQPAKKAPVVNILSALQRSLEQARGGSKHQVKHAESRKTASSTRARSASKKRTGRAA
jgi:DNA end-binding protein Ku